MRSSPDIRRQLRDPGVIAVLRLPRRELVMPVCEALVAGGVRALEITLTVPEALEALREAVAHFDGKACVGAGSVLDAVQAQAALAAGAEFLVSPVCRPEIAATARAAGRPVMLGAMTPSEAQAAHEAGADFVKLFPADGLGPGFCRALLAPLPHLKLVPTGGVDRQTAPEFIRAGCVAVGVGAPLIRPELVAAADWAGLVAAAREFVAAVAGARRGPGETPLPQSHKQGA